MQVTIFNELITILKLMILKKSIFILCLILLSRLSYSTVLGPIIIDLIGFDEKTNILYFAKTNWGEFDFETDLYKYNLTSDKLEIVTKWCKRSVYRAKRDSVLKIHRLNSLSKLTEVEGKDIFQLIWLPKKKAYSGLYMKDTMKYSFKIVIGERSYSYQICFKQEAPEIRTYKITDSIGLIIVHYRYDCLEGNMGDKAIFYNSKSKNIYSKEL
jgi:hypothetical protein